MSFTQMKLLSYAFFSMIAACGAFYLGREMVRIRSLYGDEPQAITVNELAAKGYGRNVVVDLREVELGPKSVIETRDGKVTSVWFPAFPQGQSAKSTTIQVVLRSSRCSSEAEIAERFSGRSQFQGVVTNPTKLRHEEPYRELLKKDYPKLGLASQLWEVDVDAMTRPSAEWATGCYAASAGLVAFGILCGAVGFSGVGAGRNDGPTHSLASQTRHE